ncbi:MAG: cupredoxin domain-containing protein [Patescibacteria group bacterium]|nr:cupredoxin domain-containing protein [Patescibacteria group bacterium]
MRKTIAIACIALAAGVVTGCTQQSAPANVNAVPTPQPSVSVGTNPPSPNPKVSDVEMKNFSFAPPELRIKVGEDVVWTNADASPHTVTSDTGSELGSDTIAPGATFTHRFLSAGTFAYHCSIHPSMQGTVVVE